MRDEIARHEVSNPPIEALQTEEAAAGASRVTSSDRLGSGFAAERQLVGQTASNAWYHRN